MIEIMLNLSKVHLIIVERYIGSTTS
jgi:hypothetical protein